MISVVVSAFNEEERLSLTVEKIIYSAKVVGGVPLDIIIVNDGSTDGTAEVIRGLESKYPFVRSIHYTENKGIGAGITDAINIAKYDKLCNFPGDNACSMNIMQQLFQNADKADFIISYIVNSEERGYIRHALSVLYSFIYLITFNLPIRYVNGSPLYSVSILKTLRLKSRRYSLLGEASVKCLRRGVTFMEIADYIAPGKKKTSALRWVNFKEVILNYFRLCYEIFVRYPSEYRGKSKRILPEGALLPDVALNSMGPTSASCPAEK